MILLDIMMPGVDGFEVCRRLKRDIATRHVPVIFVTAKNDITDETRGLELGAVDYIRKPISPSIVMARVKTHLYLHDQQRALYEMVRERTAELRETRMQIIHRLGRAAEYKDNETGLHVVRMSHFARMLAVGYGLSERNAELIYNAAPMHDIGKLGIPDYILQKPGKLDDDEWELMKRHPLYGAQILGDDDDDDLMVMAKSIALSHHEKWDGSGYPKQLAGEQIPLEGRIVAIADVFDALTSKRPYKEAWTVEKAVKHINKQGGKHFDPKLVKVFNKVLPEMIAIRERYSECEQDWQKEKEYFSKYKPLIANRCSWILSADPIRIRDENRVVAFLIRR